MNPEENQKPKSPKKKSNFLANLFQRKSKKSDHASSSHDSVAASGVKEVPSNTNVNNHREPSESQVTDASDFAGSENEENAHLEQAMLQSYHASNQPLQPTAPPPSAPIPRPQATRMPTSIADSTHTLISALVTPFYVIYQVLFLLFSAIRLLILGLSSLAGYSRQVSQPNRITLRDNPLIALLIFPVTMIVLIGEGLAKLKPTSTAAPRVARS
ncbi:hypothetical protein CAPTEDRAFT_225270, partial [Capitella teleta]